MKASFKINLLIDGENLKDHKENDHKFVISFESVFQRR